MAHPKRRKSKSKTRMGRSHRALKRPVLSYDSREDEFHLPHRVGPDGTYKGIQYIKVEE